MPPARHGSGFCPSDNMPTFTHVSKGQGVEVSCQDVLGFVTNKMLRSPPSILPFHPCYNDGILRNMRR